MGKVKIFCDCGKEIWQELPDKDDYKIGYIEKQAECSDCILKRLREEAN